jgi:hypothetical protein
MASWAMASFNVALNSTENKRLAPETMEVSESELGNYLLRVSTADVVILSFKQIIDL